MPTCLDSQPEIARLETPSQPTAAEIHALGRGDHPGHPAARHHHGRRRPVPADACRWPSTAGLIEKAFAYDDAPAVAISINSPGGSPVQSRLIYKRIRDLAAEKNKTVLVFVEDVAASGGYMIAVAGDEIIADPSSIVGSIGVVSASFGFPELIKKIGVERRVHTAGRNKAVLDPFLPEKPEDVERLKALQLEVHETFIDIVKERRGAKLKDDPDLFTGLFWTAKRGVELGLVDALGDMRSVLKERFGPKTKLQLITPAARAVRPPARHFRLERGRFACRYRRRGRRTA